MKINLPVTGHERMIEPGSTLVSRTDTRGFITFANDAFVEVSGYSREELINANHNIIRHPDVPSSIFENMWHTLQQGQPWQGIVKNRCKNGDHYWVDAKVVPVRKNGETIGYMSVRSIPSRETILEAEAGYAAATQEKKGITHSNGWKNLISIQNGVIACIAFVTLMMVAGGILGISGLQSSSSAIRTLYHEEMEPVQTIGRLNFLMAENRAQIALALTHRPSTRSHGKEIPGVAEHMAILTKNRVEIDVLWKAFNHIRRSGTERELAEQYWNARMRYVQEGLLPAKAALERGDFDAAEEILQDHVDPNYEEAKRTVGLLLTFVAQKAKDKAARVAEHNENISIVAMGGITVGSILFMLAGLFFFRATVIPLQAAVSDLERVAEGNLSEGSDIHGYGEPGRVINALLIMRMHLKVMMNEIRISAGSIHDQCANLNLTMMNISEGAEEQLDRIHQTLDNVTESCTGLDKLASDAEKLMLASEQAEKASDDNSGTADSVSGSPLADTKELLRMIQELASAARIEAFTLQDTIAQMRQAATLIADGRGEVQGAWAASQKLEFTAKELDKLVEYFD